MTDGETLRLGIDLGTSAVKAVVIDADGAVVATGEAAFATRTDLPGQAEQAPRDWLLAVAEAVASLGNRRRRVAGIGLAGQLPTLVCLGEREPLGPAIAW